MGDLNPEQEQTIRNYLFLFKCNLLCNCGHIYGNHWRNRPFNVNPNAMKCESCSCKTFKKINQLQLIDFIGRIKHAFRVI